MPIPDKNTRHTLIKKIISTRKVSTQAELVTILKETDRKVTQVTVSRDLNDLGVYMDMGRNCYVLPAEQIANKYQLQRVLGEWCESIIISGSIVVIKTSPGSAHVVASALDRSEQTAILATIAGDDTVFVLVEENVKNPIAQALGQELKGMIGHNF